MDPGLNLIMDQHRDPRAQGGNISGQGQAPAYNVASGRRRRVPGWAALAGSDGGLVYV
jgi:hypothetical protein